MSVMDIGPVAFGGMEKMISFLRSQHVLARSCDCNRYKCCHAVGS